jgi:hypothetical protein
MRSTSSTGDHQAADRRTRTRVGAARPGLPADHQGIPAADFSAEELLYLPRNLRAHGLYGMSPVKQIALTINIALRRDAATLDYYSAGSTPDAFATLPREWAADQIRSFQDYFDALMSGNLAAEGAGMRPPTPANLGVRTKREHFVDRLRRSWHIQLQWEKWRRR